jgi:hypothetical protein
VLFLLVCSFLIFRFRKTSNAKGSERELGEKLPTPVALSRHGDNGPSPAADTTLPMPIIELSEITVKVPAFVPALIQTDRTGLADHAHANASVMRVDTPKSNALVDVVGTSWQDGDGNAVSHAEAGGVAGRSSSAVLSATAYPLCNVRLARNVVVESPSQLESPDAKDVRKSWIPAAGGNNDAQPKEAEHSGGDHSATAPPSGPCSSGFPIAPHSDTFGAEAMCAFVGCTQNGAAPAQEVRATGAVSLPEERLQLSPGGTTVLHAVLRAITFDPPGGPSFHSSSIVADPAASGDVSPASIYSLAAGSTGDVTPASAASEAVDPVDDPASPFACS